MKSPFGREHGIPAHYTGNAVTYITKDGVEVTMIPPTNIPHLYRVAIYCRVSTSHPEQQESLEAQMSYYKDYVHQHRAWLFVGAYTDVKSARSIHARDQFERMIADSVAGKIDIIITKTVSRFGRNVVDTLSTLRILKNKGVDVFFENEGLHSIDGNDELLISLMEAIAQAESENRSQNIKWGIKQQAQNPNASIYSRPCYGYCKNNGQLEILEEEAATVRFIFSLYMTGHSVLGIKKELEAKGMLTPTGKSSYRTYCSEYPQTARIRNRGEKDQYLISNHHPAIIQRDDFDSVQAEIKRRSNVVMDENGAASRKATHYSAKRKSLT